MNQHLIWTERNSRSCAGGKAEAEGRGEEGTLAKAADSDFPLGTAGSPQADVLGAGQGAPDGPV